MIQFRRTLGIRTKLLGGFLLVAMFTGALGLNAVATLDRLNATRDAQYGQASGDTRLLVNWLNQARQSEGDLSEYMFETDPAVRTRLRAEMAVADTQLAELGTEFDGSHTAGVAQGSATLSRTWRSYADWRDQFILAPLEAGQWVEARAAFQTEGDARNATVDQAVLALNDAKDAATTALENTADAQADLERDIAIGLTGAAMLLALLIGYFLSHEIAQAAGQVAIAAKGLAVGDLDQHVTVHSGDELGQMADAVRSMIAYQHEMANVARVMATGDLTQDVQPKGTADVLGIAFGHMTTNLRMLVSDLQQQAATLSAQAQLLELASDAIMVVDVETGTIQFWNHGAEDVYGWTQTEALGKTPLALLATQLPSSWRAIEVELFRTGHWDGELVHTRRNGARLIVASRMAVQRDHAGRPVAVLQISTNITERKRAEAEGSQLATLVEHERTTLASILASMTDGILQVNQDRRVVFCNAQAAAMLGMTVDLLTDKTVPEIFAFLRPSLHDSEAVWESFNTPITEQTSFEIVFEGPPRRHLLNQRFSIGGTGAMGILLHDRTAERELVRAKDELVSMVSHELASPATSLVAYAGLLAEHDYAEPERQDMLATMVREGQRLTTIIQDFLDIQRLEHGRFQLSARPMELRSLLEHAARVAGTDAEHPLTMQVPASLPLVQADPNRVQQVLANLLSNARKYTPADGRIWLAARQIDGAIEISVADEGLGIPLEAQPHLFEKFYRVDAEDRRLIKGTGLGLAIVKEIVEALGGTIGAESAGSGHGSRFWFTLPLAETASVARERSDTGRPPALVVLPATGVLRILVVDDDAAIRSTVRRVLRPDGHQVILADSAEEALEQCRTQSFDVVLTDLGLGSGMDGWELAACIRRDWPAVRVIMASGRTGIDAAEAQTRGVAALLSKPYQADDLRRLVIDVARAVTDRAA